MCFLERVGEGAEIVGFSCSSCWALLLRRDGNNPNRKGYCGFLLPRTGTIPSLSPVLPCRLYCRGPEKEERAVDFFWNSVLDPAAISKTMRTYQLRLGSQWGLVVGGGAGDSCSRLLL